MAYLMTALQSELGCVRACAPRARVCVCVSVCARARVCACVRACVRALMCVILTTQLLRIEEEGCRKARLGR